MLVQTSLAVLAHLAAYTYPQHNAKADGQIWSPHDVDPFTRRLRLGLPDATFPSQFVIPLHVTIKYLLGVLKFRSLARAASA